MYALPAQKLSPAIYGRIQCAAKQARSKTAHLLVIIIVINGHTSILLGSSAVSADSEAQAVELQQHIQPAQGNSD